jgi:uncharacterized membrane protein YqaE (UPF0057 family)
VSTDSHVGIGAIIAAILLPPLGVFIARGLGTEFWISVVLTLVGWIPGVIFALVAILRPGLISRTA